MVTDIEVLDCGNTRRCILLEKKDSFTLIHKCCLSFNQLHLDIYLPQDRQIDSQELRQNIQIDWL